MLEENFAHPAQPEEQAVIHLVNRELDWRLSETDRGVLTDGHVEILVLPRDPAPLGKPIVSLNEDRALAGRLAENASVAQAVLDEAAPCPLLGTLREARSHGVVVDAFDGFEQLGAAPDRARVVAPAPEVSRRAVATVVAQGEDAEKPPHVLGQVSAPPRLEEQVDVVVQHGKIDDEAPVFLAEPAQVFDEKILHLGRGQ